MVRAARLVAPLAEAPWVVPVEPRVARVRSPTAARPMPAALVVPRALAVVPS